MQLDNIAVEVLRHQLEAFCGEGAATIKRTAVSPLVVEGGDYSCTLLDAKGKLVTGGGHIAYHFYAATNAIAGVFIEHGDNVHDGDVFMANDPHRGGGLHAQDVFIMKPVFAEERLVAWMANSSHLVDVGGMAPGSFAPNATDCFQEAIRLPAVKITARGVEQRDTWNILLNNVRMPHLVEMDIRGLMAGVDVGAAKLQELVLRIGADALQEGFDELNRRTEEAVRRELALIEDGVYRSTSWTEWNDEKFRVPCTTTVDGGSIRFDFTGTAPQTNHFFNSKEYIIKGKIGVELQRLIGQELPLNQGYYDAIDVHCPVGSMLNCTHPAPVGAAHLAASHDASEAAMRTFHQAVAASPNSRSRQYLSSSQTMSANSVVTFSGTGLTGSTDSWIMIDGTAVGSPAGSDRDGTDFNFYLVGKQAAIQTNDVEVTESWYPLRFEYRRRSTGVSGAGRYRGGRGVDFAFTVDGSPELSGSSIGGHGHIPMASTAGGAPGRPTSIELRDPESGSVPISTLTQGFSLPEGHSYAIKAAGGGGWGDPLDREVSAVLGDVEAGLITDQEASDVYGVNVSDGTTDRRGELLRERLASARPAINKVEQQDAEVLSAFDTYPIAPGVEQRGGYAVSIRSGSVLAQAPEHWSDGCPILVETVNAGVETRKYLDPTTGHILHTEVATADESRSFESSPARWTNWSAPQEN